MRLIVRTATIGTALACLAGPAAADSADAFLRREVLRVTPRCSANPQAPFIGRVAGDLGGQPNKTASFVGCFPTSLQCERWRLFASGRLRGRIIRATCDPR